MCTAIVRRGKDFICGFNFDITPDVPFKVFMNDRTFGLGIDIGGINRAAAERGILPETFRQYPAAAKAYLKEIENGVRKIEGVTCDGHFAVQLGSQDNHKAPFSLAPECCSIDRLTDDVISGRYSLAGCLMRTLKKEMTNPPVFPGVTPQFNMHALLADPRCGSLLIEPGTGCAVIREKYFVMTNFDLLETPLGMTGDRFGYFGRDRYDIASAALRNSDDSFNVSDALRVLESVKAEGNFATRFSFVYSHSEHRVYYAENGDFSCVKTHTFRR